MSLNYDKKNPRKTKKARNKTRDKTINRIHKPKRLIRAEHIIFTTFVIVVPLIYYLS